MPRDTSRRKTQREAVRTLADNQPRLRPQRHFCSLYAFVRACHILKRWFPSAATSVCKGSVAERIANPQLGVLLTARTRRSFTLTLHQFG